MIGQILTIDETLMKAARFHTQVLAHLDSPQSTQVHHFGPYGGSMATSVSFGGPETSANGGFSWTPEDVVQGWLNSPLHKQNMLNPNTRITGFGSQVAPDGNRVFNYILFAVATPGTPAFTELQEMVLRHINAARAGNGLAPLQMIEVDNDMRRVGRSVLVIDFDGEWAPNHAISSNARITHVHIMPSGSSAGIGFDVLIDTFR